MKERIVSVLIVVSLFFGGYFIGSLVTKQRVVYTNYVDMICKLYNETNKTTMACNPIDIEQQPDGKNITYGFELPGNSSYQPYKEIRCRYDLNAKRFILCYQLNYGVVEENDTSNQY